ncbi:unnamed protein product [Jaminaea pallidilutea]
MSTKHFFDKQEGLVDRTLRGAIAVNPALRVYRPHKVIYDATHSNEKVAIMAGGGAGHEPGQAGLIGKGMLAAAVSGDIFASPSAAQICTGMDLAHSDKGVIFIINNYTGDQLHFGLAAEKGRSALSYSSKKEKSGGVECVTVADDVAVGRSKGGLVGRRGLGMNPFSCKVLGAASERGLNVQQIKKLGDVLIANSVTIGTSLDHCHVPGRPKDPQEWGALPQEACEIGMGIHNEPGFKRLDKTPEPEKLVGEMLEYMLNAQDEDRHFLDFEKNDDPVLFVNNLGGVSQLELFALVDVTIDLLAKKYDLHPSRVYANAYMTSLNAPGFGITLVKHKAVSKDAGVDLLQLLDDPTDAYAWTGVTRGWPSRRDRAAEEKEAEQRLQQIQDEGGAVSMLEEDAKKNTTSPRNADPQLVKKAIWSACDQVIEEEPSITRHDTIVGDGDCGEGISTFAKHIQKGLESGKVDLNTAAGALMGIGEIASDVYGGTSGAIYELYIAGMVQAFSSMQSNAPAGIKEWSSAASTALESLFKFTPARKGMRTLVDSLIPFVETLQQTQDLSKAVQAAQEGRDSTKKMVPKLGRSVYQGEGNQEMFAIPDPGAEALAAVVLGLSKGLSS